MKIALKLITTKRWTIGPSAWGVVWLTQEEQTKHDLNL